ncbi:pyruvate kinase [Propioniferax innocua]|uniref:Pyruvate kinase n=1 Tax=Propioniferax innocua TaxID=1753 RepID=A0A542ZBQ8_9ACTN|nr:pyruvate kinase [Propioniferax innocua]
MGTVRRAKIVCTLGPATNDLDKIVGLVQAGMNVARLNMSHGDHAEHDRRLQLVRQAAEKVGRPVGVLADLQGPKIRLGKFAEGKVTLGYGDRFTITTEDVEGDKERCSTTYKGLTGDVTPGDRILIDDGNVHLVAEEVSRTDVVCRVTVGGPVSDHKGINLPGVAVSVPAMSEKDCDDLRWALRSGVDMIALSFVRSAKDVEPVHEIMREENRTVPVIAKIEKPQAVEAIGEIVDSFDAVMVARGDLGVELPLEQVPMAQKRIIVAARRWAKPVIVATQMLESMIHAPRPTRAEASDVANAVLDGADAVMLSGETSVGQYPITTVETMRNIVRNTESHGMDRIDVIDWDPHTTGGIMSKAAAEVAERIGATYLVAFTTSGDTARRLARLRPEIPILVFTPSRSTAQALTLSWGIKTFLVRDCDSTDEMILEVDRALVHGDFVKVGDRVVTVSGYPVGVPGKTNAVRVHKIKPPTSGHPSL